MLTFNDIFGQDRAVGLLRRAYAGVRLPHGLIFAGPAGVGKATTARALGGVFLCENPDAPAALPCGTCESCRLVEAGNHPDFHVVTKELIRYHDKTGKSKAISMSIDVIRPELIEPASRKAVMGRGKVFLVEQAETMTGQAQNSMLKTLEEPAGRALIVLLTDAPDALLPTIRSRCQLVRFASLDEPTVVRELVKRGVGQAEAAEAAHLAEGSLGVALKWLEDGVVVTARQLMELIDTLIAGKRLPADLDEWFRKAADAYAAKQLERDELASKDQATREGLGLYLRLAANRFRRRLAELEPSQDEAIERTCAAIDAVAHAESNLDANVNIPLTFQQLSAALERSLGAA